MKKPTVSLSRNGYSFVLQFSNMNDADYIFIERELIEHRDGLNSSKKQKEYHKTKLGAKSHSSWSYTINKDKYYPFADDGTTASPKQSNLNKRVEGVWFRVWVEGWVTKKVKKGKKTVTKRVYEKSDTVTKTYIFAPSVDPFVDIDYTDNMNNFTFLIDINDDHGIDDNSKRVATRAWGWLTSQVMNGQDTKVPGYTGTWYNRDTEPQIRRLITQEIHPEIPIKYTIHAYSAGPGGKSDTKTASHVFAIPKAPMAPKITRSNVLEKSDVDNGYGIYKVDWVINTEGGWYPVDKVTIEYRDQDEYKDDSDIFGNANPNWSTAKDNVDGSIRSILTDELGAVADDCVRYFRLKVYHDGYGQPGYVTGIVAYGKPSNISGLSATTPEGYSKEALLFKWTAPSSKLYGTDPNLELYNGGVLGHGGKLRIVIFRNTTSSTPIKTIYFGDPEWKDKEWVYEIPEEDLDKPIDYCFQVRVGLDNLDPGGKSDDLWANNIVVPAKCKNVKGTRLANNTTVEVTWDNPVKDDTVRNGIEVGWSTMPYAWESNSSPSTAKFSNGSMTKAYITGLTAGEFYYFWVRRYEELTDGGVNYGLWSDPSPGILLSNKPDTPTLTLSRSWIKEGGNLSAQWIYYASGNTPQTSAQVEISSNKDDEKSWVPISVIDGEEYKCTIDLSTKINESYKYPAGDYYLRVIVKNSMGSTESEPILLRIATPPTCSLSSESIVDYEFSTVIDEEGTTKTVKTKAIRTLPITVNASGDGNLNLYVYCIDDIEQEHPDGVENIFEGDCVWTSSIEEGSYSIENISLSNNGRYRIQLECANPDTLLSAEPQYLDFEVHWEHQAIKPKNSTVTIDEDGIATLIPVKPEGALDTDVCDIYRVTADGYYLCCQNVSWGKTIIDQYPTFGETIVTAYRFCTRTLEGDEDWSDIDYELDGSGIIINYGKEILKLPWNVSNDDSRTKQGEIRSHLGGSKLYFGQPYVDRSQSLSTEIVKMEDEDLVGQLYELSRYTKLCYVRTSNCIGYPATVDVSINREYNNDIVSVSLSAKEADSNGEFLGEIQT